MSLGTEGEKKVYWLHFVENMEEYSHVIGKSRDSEDGRTLNESMVLAAAAAWIENTEKIIMGRIGRQLDHDENSYCEFSNRQSQSYRYKNRSFFERT